VTTYARHRFQDVLANLIRDRLQLLRSEATQIRWRVDTL
jgi:hypothetical protein